MEEDTLEVVEVVQPSAGLTPITDGWDAEANTPKIVGFAPPAPRPAWLPEAGPGQANVDPLCWSLSVEQWIFFMRVCIGTTTWEKLAAVKGEYNISMYDINDHFVKPWTKGTGSSIALLLNMGAQLPVEGMLSHAWAGSACETYNCLQNMVNHIGIPPAARFFFCTFSMYQPQDDAPGGLSIEAQIKLEPFAKIIESRPKYGMFVLHTTLSEVYERLWVAHEADVGVDQKLQMRGLFDMYRWEVETFKKGAEVKTTNGMCSVEKDRMFIHELIMKRGGYARLDEVIKNFRLQMLEQLKQLLERTSDKGQSHGWRSLSDSDVMLDWYKYSTMEQCCNACDRTDSSDCVRWRFTGAWHAALKRLIAEYSAAESFQHLTDFGSYEYCCQDAPRPKLSRPDSRCLLAGPLGLQSFPFGNQYACLDNNGCNTGTPSGLVDTATFGGWPAAWKPAS